MAILQEQKVDYLWKKIGFGVTKSDVNSKKFAFNESIASPLLMRGDKIWAESDLIPATMPASTPAEGVVTVYAGADAVECVNDATASPNRTWKTDIVDWIPTQMGSTYLVKVYVHDENDAANAVSNGTKLTAAGSGNDDEWFFDYQSGVLHFIGENLPNGVDFTNKSIYITGAVYSGRFGAGSAISLDADTSINTTGIITATSFSGDGSEITNLDASNLTGALPAISGALLTNISASALNGPLPSVDGSALTGIVTSLTAGNNIQILESPSGNFIISSTDADTTTIQDATDLSGTLSANDFLMFNGSDFIPQQLEPIAFTADYADLTGAPVLAGVATSGDYSDLTGTPVLSTVATSGDYSDLTNTPSLSTVATSGDYNDLLNLPALFDDTATVSFTDTTDNTLGNVNTGAVQIDGGLGVEKNTTIGGGLRVQGQSYFVGVATFFGGIVNLQGDVNLGDDSSDNIHVGGDFISGLKPDTSDSFDLGINSQKWRNLFLSGYLTTDEIRHPNGTPAATIVDNGNVVIEESLTVNGDLLVTGTSTQVNTSQLEVEDRTIELGIVDGSVPSSTTTWDLGVLFNYHDGTSAKKSAVAWEQSRERFVFAHDVDDGGGIGVDNPQLTINDYASIEVGSLWIGGCTGQPEEVISCDSGQITMNSVIIDGGFF